VTKYFRGQDITKPHLPSTIWSSNNSAELVNVFEELGFDTSLQSFTMMRDSNQIKGRNVHGIFRAPRAEGTEAILIMAPLYTSNGKRNELFNNS
jgi:hypothetical protein